MGKLPVPLLPSYLRWAGVVAVAVFIFYNSIIVVPDDIPTVVDSFRFGLERGHWRHLVAYITLALSLAYATESWEFSRWKNAAVVIALAAGYGVCMEFGQVFVPYRSHFLVTDVVVNTIGASLVLLWYLVRPRLTFLTVSEIRENITKFRKN